MTVAYFDCFSGVAGDMVLGALVDAGMPLAHLRRELKKLALPPHRISCSPVRRGICGTDLAVAVRRELPRSDYPFLDALIARSRLSRPVRETARAIFAGLARAEARVHGTAPRRVHFHEVGAVDSVVDIVGTAIGIEYFRFAEIHVSPLPVTRGRVEGAHGTLPVPAPATMELLKGVPLEPAPVKGEIVTPTGAAILTTVASHFGECPLQRIDRVGYGFGDKILPGMPNALRLLIGEGFPTVAIESNVDDMNPQLFEAAMERCFAAGAVDVHLEPVQMKKGRPGIKLCALAPWAAKDAVIGAILVHTTSFGVRYWPVERQVLTRELVTKKVRRGTIAFKVGCDSSGRIVKVLPEYEGVKKLAQKTKRPLAECYQEALAVARRVRFTESPFLTQQVGIPSRGRACKESMVIERGARQSLSRALK